MIALRLSRRSGHRAHDGIQRWRDLRISASIEYRSDSTVGLLATKFTMEKDFYRSRIEANGFRVLVPDPDDRLLVHRIIYDELCLSAGSNRRRASSTAA
jgi:aspartate/glutamate racemase